MGLCIDIDNPFALLRGDLIWRNYFGMMPTQLTHQTLHEKIKVATAAVGLLLEARSPFHYRQLQTD